MGPWDLGTTMSEVHPHLSKCRDELHAALAGVSPDQADVARDGKWSIAAIVEHLDLTYARNADGFARRLAKGRPPAPRAVSWRQRLWRVAITRLAYYPIGWPAPAPITPLGKRFAESVVAIDPHLLVLDQRLKDAARVFGARTPIVIHPYLGPLSVADWRRFHLAHTRHHLRQIHGQVRRQRAEGRGQK